MNGKSTMTAAERERLDQIRGALEAHMELVKPKRYEHSLGVAETAGRLARTYGVDEFQAQAVDRHTVGAEDMSPLDMVVFVADAMEPHRKGDYADRLRELAGKVSLTELFFQCFSQGLVYVIQTGRYLYPTAVGIYNTYAMMDGRNEPASN